MIILVYFRQVPPLQRSPLRLFKLACLVLPRIEQSLENTQKDSNS